MNALEMKLIAMKFALARKAYVPNDQKFTSTSGAYDVGTIQQQLSQGIVIDDRDLTINNTIVEDCDHEANAEPKVETVADNPELTPEPVVPTPIQTVTPEPVTTTPPAAVQAQPVVQPDANQSFGGRIWQYFKDTTNVQPKP